MNELNSAGVFVYLYSPNRSMWVGKADLERRPGHVNELVALPTLTSKESDAELFFLSALDSSSSAGAALKTNQIVRFRSPQNNTGNRVYLGISGAQDIVYADADQKDAVEWKLVPVVKNQRDVRGKLAFGVGYQIKNAAGGMSLGVHTYIPKLLASDDSSAATFILQPGFSLFTCHGEVSQCSETGSWENLFLRMTCSDTDTVQCKDKFGRRVYFSQNSCDQTCGRQDREAQVPRTAGIAAQASVVPGLALAPAPGQAPVPDQKKRIPTAGVVILSILLAVALVVLFSLIQRRRNV